MGQQIVDGSCRETWADPLSARGPSTDCNVGRAGSGGAVHQGAGSVRCPSG